MTRAGRLGVGVVGAGRVGPVLGAALAGAGHAVVGITAGSDPERAEAVLPSVPVLDTLEVIRRSELVVLAVPHDQLPGLVAGVAALSGWQPGQLVLHTDPGYGVDVLADATAAGAIPLAVHPAVAFSGTSLDLRQLAGGYAAVTAPAPVLPIAQALAVEMGLEPVIIAEADRAAYAEAVHTATDFSRSVVRQATGALASVGVDNPGRYLSALIRSAVDQALTEAVKPGDPPID
jgi:predicted short-subunit dehydrogenase-like oxidoreductase (DUF2520 family)